MVPQPPYLIPRRIRLVANTISEPRHYGYHWHLEVTVITFCRTAMEAAMKGSW
jgi:hypothetical protein